jgi:hypothetical protein
VAEEENPVTVTVNLVLRAGVLDCVNRTVPLLPVAVSCIVGAVVTANAVEGAKLLTEFEPAVAFTSAVTNLVR